jgi:hypothetical protein
MTNERESAKVFNFAFRPDSTATRLRLANTYVWVVDAGSDQHRLGYVERLDRIESEQVLINVETLPHLLAMADEVLQDVAWSTPRWRSPQMTVEAES